MGRVSKALTDRGGWDGVRREPLTPDVLHGSQVAVLTLDSYQEVPMEGRKVPRVVLVFQEYPQFCLWGGAQMASRLVAGTGTDDTDAMRGQLIPLVRSDVQDPSTGAMVDKYVIADPDDWPDLLAEYRRQMKAASQPKTTKRTKSAKRGRK